VIGSVDRSIQGGIPVDTHRPLHPVDNALTLGARWAVAADEDSRIVSELSERLRKDGAEHASFYFLLERRVCADLQSFLM